MFLLNQIAVIVPKTTKFSSPIFGDMFLLKLVLLKLNIKSDSFSSPIFGDMFLLKLDFELDEEKLMFSSPIFGDMFLLKRY